MRSWGHVGVTKRLASGNSCHGDGWTLRERAELDISHHIVECGPREKHPPRREAIVTFEGWGRNGVIYL